MNSSNRQTPITREVRLTVAVFLFFLFPVPKTLAFPEKQTVRVFPLPEDRYFWPSDFA